jgi:hypothetical protein
MLSIILTAALLAGNHYSWSGFDARFADANNWGSMDYPRTGDDITVDQLFGIIL